MNCTGYGTFGEKGLEGGENMLWTGRNMVLKPLFMLRKKPLKPFMKPNCACTATAKSATTIAATDNHLIVTVMRTQATTNLFTEPLPITD